MSLLRTCPYPFRRAHHARRDVHRGARTRVRTKDLDLIELDLHPANRARLERQAIDEDKPGLGQHVSPVLLSICSGSNRVEPQGSERERLNQALLGISQLPNARPKP